jgi:hypothetical protein
MLNVDFSDTTYSDSSLADATSCYETMTYVNWYRFCLFLNRMACAYTYCVRMQGKTKKGHQVMKTLVIMIVICCSTVAYATSVSVMMMAPETAVANSVSLTPTDISTVLTVIYGEYSDVLDKGGVDYSTSALSSSFQQGINNPGSANTERGFLPDESGGDTPTPNPSTPLPVPEPNALLLAGVGLAGFGISLRLRR